MTYKYLINNLLLPTSKHVRAVQTFTAASSLILVLLFIWHFIFASPAMCACSIRFIVLYFYTINVNRDYDISASSIYTKYVYRSAIGDRL